MVEAAREEDGGRSTHALVQQFVTARRDDRYVVLEGHHAVKHALRFGAQLSAVALLEDTPDADLPPELHATQVTVHRLSPPTFDRLLPGRPPVPLVAVAARPSVDVRAALEPSDAPLVVLERPTHHGNVGAVVRVAAAAGAHGVVTVGGADPWHPTAVRGGAGLQFALPVARLSGLLPTRRPVVALDPAGTPLGDARLPRGAALIFGTERRGLSDEVRRRADVSVAIPMRPGVSSLNLATAVAVVLYTGPWRRW
ncbi:MAG: TrmH family RNA methyltransferase [Actinobacteria bacterium]|nr:TrmH family RNA methyltransferase [Actinomycetota bacterium]